MRARIGEIYARRFANTAKKSVITHPGAKETDGPNAIATGFYILSDISKSG
jgi:hypothetical protein